MKMKKIIIVFILVLFPTVVFTQDDADTCKAMYQEIESDLAQANYCSQDSDCEVLELGGHLIKFGCYHFVNKDTDREAIYEKMHAYYDKCEQMINDCDRSPNPVCRNNKCVAGDEPVVTGLIL